MGPAWQILHRAGVPLLAEASGPAPSAGEIGLAVREVLQTSPRGREAEALAAFLFAWQQHFPTSFAEALDGEALVWAQRQLTDPNRYLKLRRIALAHLAEIL
jgi:hypothetical protein